MTAYEDMDAAELRADLDDWTARCFQWADDLADAISAGDYWRAVALLHGYRQARNQVKKIRHFLQIGIA